MGTLYLLAFTLLLYSFFGTIVDVFIASRLLNIKTKIIFRNFIAPGMFALVLAFTKFKGNMILDIFIGIALIAGGLIGFLGRNGKYLTALSIEDSSLNVSYLTQFLKPRAMKFDLSAISDLKYEKADWSIDFPATVDITYNDDRIEFVIINKKLKAEVREAIQTANARVDGLGST
jgi:hypothetical protein